RSFLLLILTSWLVACNGNEITNPEQDDQNDDALNKIMPLGASRVEGDPPAYESYRYELWKLLIDSGYDFDFIGVEKDRAGVYADYEGQKFDVDHEGRGGIDSGGILEELEFTLEELNSPPDIVLFSSPGGNDRRENYPQTVLNVNAIIDKFQAVNPNVTIFIELLAPPMTKEQTPAFQAYYNQALKDIALVAEQQTTATSKVITIDMTAAAGFTDAFLADDVHYNQAGAVFIANRYFEALKEVLR
ncbi:MAG: GDSL-type esterase/lipase family protein, partial [Bacteroidota bacterium]